MEWTSSQQLLRERLRPRHGPVAHPTRTQEQRAGVCARARTPGPCATLRPPRASGRVLPDAAPVLNVPVGQAAQVFFVPASPSWSAPKPALQRHSKSAAPVQPDTCTVDEESQLRHAVQPGAG